MIEHIAEEITEPALSELKRLGIDEIALVKGQKNCLNCALKEKIYALKAFSKKNAFNIIAQIFFSA